jgi:hypothetical protein
MSPRGLIQYGGPPGWLEESDPAGVILNVMNGPYRLPFPCRTGCPGCEMMEVPAAFCILYIYSPHWRFTSFHLHAVCSAREPTHYTVIYGNVRILAHIIVRASKVYIYMYSISCASIFVCHQLLQTTFFPNLHTYNKMKAHLNIYEQNT